MKRRPYYDDEFVPYVPVDMRRLRASREIARLAKIGQVVSPVVIEGRKIAHTFWGEAWCENLERYSDYANRLPRGRTYVRNGSVIDLQISPADVTALVCGKDTYKVHVKVTPLSPDRWKAVCRDCAGAIDSVVELLQGRFSKGVMARLCDEKTGLFPSPAEIKFNCSCPDWATMCKHVAAVLYGIGARLDEKPELLFVLRKVDEQELITSAGGDLSQTTRGPAADKILDVEDLSELFGIDIAPIKAAARGASAKTTAKPETPASTRSKPAHKQSRHPIKKRARTAR